MVTFPPSMFSGPPLSWKTLICISLESERVTCAIFAKGKIDQSPDIGFSANRSWDHGEVPFSWTDADRMPTALVPKLIWPKTR